MDGLPYEFYKKFWSDIKKYLLESYAHSFKTGKLNITQKQGIITLIPKAKKDPLKLKNWRPISLLNFDYKLLTKCLASRLRKVIPDIIYSDQTGFMSNRYIGENINKILN